MPLALRETLIPLWSFAASPSISWPICTQEVPIKSYILTCPELEPLSSFEGAPIATLVPSALRETENPLLLDPASPSISSPNGNHVFIYCLTIIFSQ